MCHFQKGTTQEIAIIFSCPGKKEKKAGYPAAGITGSNLSKLINMLNNMSIFPFNNLKKKNLRITNAWSKVEYEELTERSEASFEEIMNKDNLDRLNEEIKDINNLILCFGDRAKVAVLALKYANKIKNNLKIIFVEHLGMQSLNRIKYDMNGNEIISVRKQKEAGLNKCEKEIGAKNTEKRLRIVANKINKQFNKTP